MPDREGESLRTAESAAGNAATFRLVDLSPAGSGSDAHASIERELQRLATEGWEPVAFNGLSINGAYTFLLRRASS